tara:strand:- start:555 stop:662 length:108 start_codon:yes stop_codon:yes gene_type:complete
MIILLPKTKTKKQINEMFELAWKCLDETAQFTGII